MQTDLPKNIMGRRRKKVGNAKKIAHPLWVAARWVSRYRHVGMPTHAFAGDGVCCSAVACHPEPAAMMRLLSLAFERFVALHSFPCARGEGGEESFSLRMGYEAGDQRGLHAMNDISLVINIYFSILPNQQRARSDFCLILYMINYGRVGKYNMRKSKRYSTRRTNGDGTHPSDQARVSKGLGFGQPMVRSSPALDSESVSLHFFCHRWPQSCFLLQSCCGPR
jgi:hypothetical protein